MRLYPNLLQISVLLLVLTLNPNVTEGKSPPDDSKDTVVPTAETLSPVVTFEETLTSGERSKRQLFREQIPHHRPLSGNIYAHHHGYPHPGRWHANQQQILPANYNSGHHFDSPNVIITDDDFNRYGSTLQHIDDHRIRTNPEPVLHEYPTEFGKVVHLGDGGEGHDHSSVPIEVPIVATHHHIHHHGGTAQTYTAHGGDDYSSVHNGGGSYTGHGHGHGVIYSSVSPPIKSSKPFFGFKLPQFLSHKMSFGGGGFLKGLLNRSSGYGRGQEPVSWTAVHRRS